MSGLEEKRRYSGIRSIKSDLHDIYPNTLIYHIYKLRPIIEPHGALL